MGIKTDKGSTFRGAKQEYDGEANFVHGPDRRDTEFLDQ